MQKSRARESRRVARQAKRRQQRLLILGIVLLVLAGVVYLVYSRSSQPTQGPPEIGKDVEPVTTASGLQYQDIVVGEGDQADALDLVSVHYTGWTEDGNMFDTSLDNNKPIQLTLGTGMVIKGWDEGLQGMKVGGKRRLIIPSALAYGEEGSPPDIPPNATLIFDVELVEVQ